MQMTPSFIHETAFLVLHRSYVTGHLPAVFCVAQNSSISQHALNWYRSNICFLKEPLEAAGLNIFALLMETSKSKCIFWTKITSGSQK